MKDIVVSAEELWSNIIVFNEVAGEVLGYK